MKREKIIPIKYQKSDLYGSIWLAKDHHKSNPTKSDLVGFILLAENQGDRDNSRSPNATLLIYKGISKGLGCIFRRFREIRHNLTEGQEIK